ncbi:MAG: TOMM precursor leader peptide-binding protein [Alphaproteobacteria bacterium]|nr:MAG: TOMM precursor leader peptide-binding protein [Alphaproteobacteria bacterium]
MKRNQRIAPRGSKDVLRFAPNFSVYVLPPDSVCLYSEDRKFFLHGELYCALASAIAEDGKSVRALVRDLEQKFPSDKIDEAIKRLLDRRFAVSKPHSARDSAAAYWASLGLPPETAEKNLQNYPVRIQSFDVQGGKELAAALSELGVRIAKRSAALTIALVGDYLDARLAELNRKNLSDRTPWVVVQPSGIFPLVGPVLRPGKGACWVCLAARMVRNREIKGMLDRKGARQVAASPLARQPVGQSGIALAAVEIAKAIATEFRTDLSDHILSLDLLGSTIVRHYVPARPQCPACGRKELRDLSRAPLPLKLAAGGKLVMTSGGYRTVSSGATVARFRKHVSPLTGVVSRLERIDADLPMNTNYFATHNFSAPAMSVNELRAGLSGGSFGKGSTAEQGEASALMEAIERYSGIFQGDEIRTTRRFADFAAGEAIHPNDVLLFSEAQYRRHQERGDDDEVTPTPAPFDPSAQIEWSPVWSLRHERFKYLPSSLLYFFYRGGGYQHHADSNGCAAGNTLEEAIVQGFLELVERDAYAIWWYNRLQRPQVDLGQFADSYIHDLEHQLAETGRRLWVLDITSDLGIPAFVTIAHWMKDGQEFIDFGSGAHFDARIAVLRAMTELNQFLSIGLMGARAQVPSREGSSESAFRLQEHPYLAPSGASAMRPEPGAKFGRLEAGKQVSACVEIAKRAGLDFLVLDQTRPDIEVPVVRVIVPGLRHFYRRFAPGRLYDVPIKLGWREHPLSEHELNPLHPQT